MSTTLETALRDMLQERAGDIEAVPARLTHLDRGADFEPDEEVLDARPARHSGWLLAAAVALIVAVAGAIIGIRQLGDHDTRPAAPNPTVSPSGSPSPSKSTSAPTSPVALACKATLPKAWHNAFRSEPQTLGTQAAFPLAVSSDGTEVLAARDFGSRRDVVLANEDGHVRVLYTVPEPDLNLVMSGSMEGDWAVLNLSREPRNSNGVDATDVAVVLIDLRNATVRNLATVTESQYRKGGKRINNAVIQSGQVYWDVRPTYGSHRGSIEDYDIATGTQHTLVADKAGWLWPTASPLGVSWSYMPDATVAVPAQLPPAIERNLGGLQYGARVASDGRTYAWVNPVGVLHWWTPGSSAPKQVGVPRLGSAHLVTEDMIVAGQFVIVDNKIIDMRTGTWTPEPQMTTGSLTPMMAADGILVGYEFTGAFKESATGVVRVDTSSLPDLHC